MTLMWLHVPIEQVKVVSDLFKISLYTHSSILCMCSPIVGHDVFSLAYLYDGCLFCAGLCWCWSVPFNWSLCLLSSSHSFFHCCSLCSTLLQNVMASESNKSNQSRALHCLIMRGPQVKMSLTPVHTVTHHSPRLIQPGNCSSQSQPHNSSNYFENVNVYTDGF